MPESSGKVAIVADAHIHPFARFSYTADSGLNSWVDEGVRVLRQVFERCVVEDVEEVWFLGDLFEVGQKLDTASLNAVLQLFEQYGGSKYPIRMVAGNHDQVVRGGAQSGLAAFDLIEGVRVYQETTAFKFGSLHVLAVPYTEDAETLTGQIESFRCGTVDRRRILIGHLPLAGATVGSGQYKPPSPIGPAIFDEVFDEVYLGHYHEPQTLGAGKNMQYVGALLSHDFGDTRTEKGFIVVDFKPLLDDIHTLVQQQFINIPSTSFIVLDSTCEKARPGDEVLGSIVRVDHAGLGQEDQDRIRKMYEDAGARRVLFNQTRADEIELRVLTQTGEEPSDDDYIAKYVEDNGQGLDPSRLIETAKRLMSVEEELAC